MLTMLAAGTAKSWPFVLEALKHQAYAHDVGRLGKQSGKRHSFDDHDVGACVGS